MSKSKQAGFTLIELMIVVMIVAVLTSLAYAAYTQQIVKSRRAAATACLMGQVQYMERYYTTRFSYEGASAPGGGCVAELSRHYTFASTATASGYTLSAEPVGLQARSDGRCMTLSINERGVKSRSGTAGEVLNCW